MRSRIVMGIQTRTTWTDGSGIEHDLCDMDTSHIVNCIGYIKAKKDALEAANVELASIGMNSAALEQRISEMHTSMVSLGGELMRREVLHESDENGVILR